MRGDHAALPDGPETLWNRLLDRLISPRTSLALGLVSAISMVASVNLATTGRQHLAEPRPQTAFAAPENRSTTSSGGQSSDLQVNSAGGAVASNAEDASPRPTSTPTPVTTPSPSSLPETSVPVAAAVAAVPAVIATTAPRAAIVVATPVAKAATPRPSATPATEPASHASAATVEEGAPALATCDTSGRVCQLSYDAAGRTLSGVFPCEGDLTAVERTGKVTVTYTPGRSSCQVTTLTVSLPKKLGRRTVVDDSGSAVVVD